MATKKNITKEVAAPEDYFEAELSSAIQHMQVNAPEFTGALKDELQDLKTKIIHIHKVHVKQELEDKEAQLNDLLKVLETMEGDLNALKTVVLRMAVAQYAN